MNTAPLSTEAYMALDNQIESILDEHKSTLDLADTQIVIVELKDNQCGFWAWSSTEHDTNLDTVTLLGVYGDEGMELIAGKLQVRYGRPVTAEWSHLEDAERDFLRANVLPPVEEFADELARTRVWVNHYLGTSEPPTTAYTYDVTPQNVRPMLSYLAGVVMGLSCVRAPYFEEEFTPRTVSAVENWVYDLQRLLAHCVDGEGEKVQDAASNFLTALKVAGWSSDHDVQRVAMQLHDMALISERSK